MSVILAQGGRESVSLTSVFSHIDASDKLERVGDGAGISQCQSANE